MGGMTHVMTRRSRAATPRLLVGAWLDEYQVPKEPHRRSTSVFEYLLEGKMPKSEYNFWTFPLRL
jgi:hypothetical protein